MMDDLLRDFLNQRPLGGLKAPCEYALLGGGKRMRGHLAGAAFLSRAVDASPNAALHASCIALECLHAYSLIHDDLPALDDDALRRGKPTCHKAFDEATAILTGDVLQTLAFEALAAHQTLLTVFASRARRMVVGQMKDIACENQDISQDVLMSIHADKTGALIEAALMMGALAYDASTDPGPYCKLGQILGLAYQVQDDILDITKTSLELGKDAQSDLKHNKATYVRHLGLDGAQAKAADLLNKARALVCIVPNPTPLCDIIDAIAKRGH